MIISLPFICREHLKFPFPRPCPLRFSPKRTARTRACTPGLIVVELKTSGECESNSRDQSAKECSRKPIE